LRRHLGAQRNQSPDDRAVPSIGCIVQRYRAVALARAHVDTEARESLHCCGVTVLGS
jgi:hypothetical protein